MGLVAGLELKAGPELRSELELDQILVLVLDLGLVARLELRA